MGATQKRHALKLPLLVVFGAIASVLVIIRSGLPCAASFYHAVHAKPAPLPRFVLIQRIIPLEWEEQGTRDGSTHDSVTGTRWRHKLALARYNHLEACSHYIIRDKVP
jgi:hypothetical protein